MLKIHSILPLIGVAAVKREEYLASDFINAVQQINGREGETAAFLSRRLLNSELRVGGFAPRHLNRSMLRGGNGSN